MRYLLWFLMFFRFILFLTLMTIGGIFQLVGNLFINSAKKLMNCTEEFFYE
jgi:hypothetical protein